MTDKLVRTIYESTLISLRAAFIFICLRFFARRYKRVPLWYDDWFALLALVRLFLLPPSSPVQLDNVV